MKGRNSINNPFIHPLYLVRVSRQRRSEPHWCLFELISQRLPRCSQTSEPLSEVNECHGRNLNFTFSIYTLSQLLRLNFSHTTSRAILDCYVTHYFSLFHITTTIYELLLNNRSYHTYLKEKVLVVSHFLGTKISFSRYNHHCMPKVPFFVKISNHKG